MLWSCANRSRRMCRSAIRSFPGWRSSWLRAVPTIAEIADALGISSDAVSNLNLVQRVFVEIVCAEARNLVAMRLDWHEADMAFANCDVRLWV
jgi:L-fucose isomerase-like protein